MVTSSKGLGPEKDYAGESQQHIKTADPCSHQRGRPTLSLQMSDSTKDLALNPRRLLYFKTDWPTDHRS
jgi:hypothetical protein